MPIWLRRFTHQQIYKARSAENEANNISSLSNNPSGHLDKPPKPSSTPPKVKLPNYITKASKK